MLEVSGLLAGYGRIPVLHGVSIRVSEGQIVGVLGPNGAGKTTLARAISRLNTVRAGSVVFEGRPLKGLRAQDVVRLGLLHVPQGRLLFAEMTVQENLEMGGYLGSGGRSLGQALADVYAFFPILAERRQQLAGLLSGGQQQMLAIGRAMMMRPRLLILDEPSIGLAPRTIAEIFGAIGEINRRGAAILLIEQNARRAMSVAQYCYILESGRIAAEGSAAALAENETVRDVYLGLR